VNEVIESLALENIEARPVWKPLHMQPLFERNQFYSHDQHAAVSEKLFQTGICLPSCTSMTEEDQGRVIECLTAALTKVKEVTI
jgi:pyridoxal phosphate-dependent aminotransferase EpsN